MFKDTEIRICDIANEIRNMAPIMIFINGKKVWSDDVDLTDVESENAIFLIQENLDQLNKVLHRTDFVWEITYHIVHHHHSAVYIKVV
jgi:hypothetical protein